ncbi:ATP-grasp fold amidoligase family protein [Klebsiella sp. BIGb0407]|uniref:ATP-grasp fold amidoligase family protein n=1 Tax=Klebsiella sp. BIGb0407 TaxID=2940603 RepID=UPI0021698E50|nr:ATP-grasp fold amidoligase family protein [Klebsiella sp. BIGb0407]MCS3430535.1 hypothetical protein [Klebsiella sp. BIGb0407]
MNKKLKACIRDSLRFILGKKNYTRIRFYIVHGYFLNLKSPKTFSEKIIARKFDNESIKYSTFVDKYVVREYVARTIGNEFLIPIIDKKNFLKVDDFNEYPNSFVIKTSNGGGGENVLIVEDKSKLDLEKICIQFNSYLKIKIGKAIDEEFYDIEKPCIIIERLMKHQDGSYPSDYKIHIFNDINEKRNIFIQVDTDRFSDHKRSIYNESLEVESFNIQPKYKKVDANYCFPQNIKKLINLAKTLSDGFSYVRVDMYSIDGHIYFGEMTFCHGSGWEPISSKHADLMLGNLWREYNY